MTNSSRADTRTRHASSGGDSGMLVERRVREGAYTPCIKLHHYTLLALRSSSYPLLFPLPLFHFFGCRPVSPPSLSLSLYKKTVTN